jgi:hypothetical protein
MKGADYLSYLEISSEFRLSSSFQKASALTYLRRKAQAATTKIKMLLCTWYDKLK